MAARLHSEFTSSYGIDYVIQFHDNEFTGASTKINVSGDGFQLNYSGQTDNIYSPIIGSSLNINILNRGEPALLQYIELLKQYQQDRFSIVVNRIFTNNDANVFAQYESRVAADGGSVESPSCYKQDVIDLGGSISTTQELFWAGMIVQDLIEVEDVSFPSIFSIQATDGISKLKDTLCGTSFFRQFTNQFINALDQVGALEIYGANDPVFVVVSNWWAQEMTYNANNNPLDETFADFHAFDTIDEQGVYTNKNWFEILSQMCTIFGLRFYYSNGQYRLEQLFQRETSSMIEHRYKKNKTKIDQSVVSYERTIDQLSGQARLAGNIFNFLPAVNDVSVTLNQEPKAMKGVTWKNGVDPDLAVGLVSSALQNQLTLVFNHQIKLFVDVNVNQNNIFAKLKLNVQLFDFDNNVTYYLKRTFSGMTPSAPVWTTTQSGSGYEILVGSFIEFKTQQAISGYTEVYQIGGPTTIVTPTIPTDGDMTINWDFVGFVNTNGSVRGLNVGNSSSYKMTLQSVATSFGSIQNQTTRIRAVSPNADVNGLVSYELPETSIFTGQGERGSLVKQTSVGGLLIKVPYTNWREGNSGSYQSIQNLVCQEFLKLMNNPVEKYAGAMFSVHDFKERLKFDKKIWIQLGGTFNANRDEWDGEWFVIEKAPITPTFDDAAFPSDNVGFGNVNSLTGGVSFDEIDAVNLDTNVLDVTTTANVGGNTTLGGTLGVTGNSVLAATSVGEFTTTGRVNVTLNEVTGTPSGSETLSPSKNFNFIDFASGENGTYTLNLPASEPGLIMRFKTDGSVAANKKISLTPQSGERIDGESLYSMSRPYDGVTLMGGPSGDWFVIQKKEK